MSWLKQRHPDWIETAHEWQYALDHLEGDVFGENQRTRFTGTGQGAGVPEGGTGTGTRVINTAHNQEGDPVELDEDTELDRSVDDAYLIKRSQGETQEAYIERRRISSYTPYFQYAVISLAGDLFEKEAEGLTRTWQPEDAGDGFGDPEEEGTTAQILSDNFNGQGESQNTVLRNVMVNLISTKTQWAVVEGTKKDEDGNRTAEAAVRLVSPLDADNWIRKDGRLVEAKVRVLRDTRSGLKDDIEKSREERFVVYDLEGWTRYKENSDGDAEEVASGDYEYYRTANRNQRRLPIFRTSVPVRGNPGYLAARQNNSLFNSESAIDFSLWIASFAKLFADVQDQDGHLAEDLWDEFQEATRRGDNVLPGAGHNYGAPPSNHIEAYMSWLEVKLKNFFRTFFQGFADSAKEKTATEVRQERKQGVAAYLTLLTSAILDFERTAAFLLEQQYFPDRPQLWGQYSVERSTDFDLVDMDERVDTMVRRFLPKGRVPVGTDTAMEVVKTAIKHANLPMPEDDSELRDAVDQMLSREAQAQSIQQDFGL